MNASQSPLSQRAPDALKPACSSRQYATHSSTGTGPCGATLDEK